MMYPVGTGGQQQRASFGHDASGWEEGHSDRHSHGTSVPLTTIPHNSLGTEGGRVVFKVRLGTDIRRIPLNNEDLTYNEFILMMQRIFRGKLSSSDEIVVKYKDEDGDLITIVDDPDLAFAMQTHKTLKLVLLVNGDAGVVGQPKGGESNGESSDLMEAVRELQNKLAEIPSSLEQGFQRVMEKVLSECSAVSPEKGDKGGRSGVDHQRTEQIPAAKTAKFPSAVENGFDDLSLRGVADGQQNQEQLRHEMDVEQSGSVRIGEQKEVPAPAQHPQHGMLQGQHGQPAQQQPNVHQFPSQAHGQQQPYGQQPQHQMQQPSQLQQQQLMQQHAAQQHAAQQQAAQQQAAQQQAAQQQAAQQQAAQQQAAQQQAAQHQHHLMQQQLQQQQLQQQQQQSPQQQQQALGAQLKAQYSFPPPAGAPPMPQQMGQGGPPPGGMSRPPSQPQMSQNPGQPVGPPPMMGGPGQFPPGGNPYARPPGVSPMGPPPPGFQSGMFQGQPPQSYGAQFMQPPPK